MRRRPTVEPLEGRTPPSTLPIALDLPPTFPPYEPELPPVPGTPNPYPGTPPPGGPSEPDR